MRKRAAASVALAGLCGAAEPAHGRLSASGESAADPARPSLIAAVARGRSVAVHAAPGGRAIARIRHRTPFGSPVRLAVLDRRGGWLRVSTEKAQRGWVRQTGALRLSSTRYRVTISLSRRRLELRHGDRLLLRSAVAVGTASSPTPTGRFGVTDKLPGRRFRGVYGCCVLAISAIQTQLPQGWRGGNRIALHGTNFPASFGQAVSSGCVRVRERPLRELMRRLPLGTPVVIRH